VTIAAVTPPDAASDPKHPDHDRWVKDRTLKMEIEHAQLVGLTLRDAEAENARMLARAEQKAKEAGPAIKTKAPISRDREMRHATRGITRKAPKKAKKPECACGLCVPCRRKMRVLAIFQRRQDPAIKAFGDNLFTSFLAATTGKGEFAGLRPGDAKRALTARIDRICDASVFLMGTWR
jgi:hypothetical protein